MKELVKKTESEFNEICRQRNQKIFKHLLETESDFIQITTPDGEVVWLTCPNKEDSIYPNEYSNISSVSAGSLLFVSDTFVQVTYNRLQGFSPELLITDPKFLELVRDELTKARIKSEDNYSGYQHGTTTRVLYQDFRDIWFKQLDLQDPRDIEILLREVYKKEQIKPPQDPADIVIEIIDRRITPITIIGGNNPLSL